MRASSFAAVALVFIALTAWPLHSQSPAPRAESPTRVVEGRVLGPEGRALRGVRVQVLAPPSTFEPVYSDETGSYTVGVPSGSRYMIQLSKGGYVSQRLDAATVDERLPIRMVRGAAINGQVVDRFGDAGVGLGVLVTAVGTGPATQEYVAQTDDQGEFRIGSLPAGRYAVQLTRGNILFDDKTAALTIPLIDSYASTTTPREIALRDGEEVRLALVHDAGNDTVQRGTIAAAAFERDQARSAGPAASSKEGSGIEGWVVDDRGSPARGTVIQLEPVTAGPSDQVPLLAPQAARRTSSDAEGRYAFTGVAPGRYAIFTRRGGYGLSADVSPGSLQVIQVRANATASVPLSVARGSAVGGTIVDRYGDAVEGAMVQLRRVQYVRGRAVLEGSQDLPVRLSDDRGHYRFPDVPPGQYYISVEHNGRDTYYPGRSSLSEAAGVRVDAGSDLLNLPVALQDTTRVRIFGVVNGAKDGAEVILAESVRSGATVARIRSLPLAGGVFEFRVPPGDYVLQVIERSRVAGAFLSDNIRMDTGIAAFAMQYVSVRDEAVGPLAVTATRSSTLSGHIRLEAPRAQLPFVLGVAPSDPDRSPIDGQATISRVALPPVPATSDLAFAIDGVSGPFRVTLLGAARWWLKSAIVDGVDAAVDPVTLGGGRSLSDVEVVLSGDVATLEGRIDDRRLLRSSAMVIAFATDSRRWFFGTQFVRQVAASRDGVFAVADLPPGDYHVIAVDDLPADLTLTNITSAEFLSDLIPRARRVRLPPSRRVQVELPLRSTR